MFKRVLIANRGEIASRIQRTLRRLRIHSVVVYSDADRSARYVLEADTAIHIGPTPSHESYLNQDRIIAAAKQSGAQAIHPGYGFLSENAAFAQACADAGITFIGPSPDHLLAFGLKHRARELAAQNDVPLVPGTGPLPNIDKAIWHANALGYPLMLKSSGGGGGIGMSRCNNQDDLRQHFDAIQGLASRHFASHEVFLERFITRARHIEVQFFGDGKGRVAILGERDCSAQRRNQKVIEESPAPGLDDDTRHAMFEATRRLMSAVRYASAGTLEFVYDIDAKQAYFLEVNTRLQVEHPVTELRTGIDLVEWMIRQAAGEDLPLDTDPPSTGHAIEARVYAEDPYLDFRPSAGRLTHVHFPPATRHIRVDTWIESGTEVSTAYDPMLAKVIVHADTRPQAIAALQKALHQTRVEGIETNLHFLGSTLQQTPFQSGQVHTAMLNETQATVSTGIEVRDGGTQTSIQSFPGRLGYWHVGVPPSGPMDDASLRLANAILGNPPTAAGLECTIQGPSLYFRAETTICLTGANLQPAVDGKSVPMFTPINVPAGATLRLKTIHGPGMRGYLAVAGGFHVPDVLGSTATFLLGQFGGHAGRALRTGDVLHTKKRNDQTPRATHQDLNPQTLKLTNAWTLHVLVGPHGAPDFFTESDITTFFDSEWTIHHNSDRTGVRLIGPKPQWARADGGEAGLHPSNIHDTPYAIGAIDFTGDMPVILGPDGPSLGGFVCPATIITADRWKMGQLKPGDTVRFVPVENQPETTEPTDLTPIPPLTSPILHRETPADFPEVVVRQSGDRNLLIELGPMTLDIGLRLRVHLLMTELLRRDIPDIVDITPGIRSLQIHFRPPLTADNVLDLVRQTIGDLPAVDNVEVPSRIVHLPLSWDDPSTQLAIERYATTVRPNAPWCPSNLEFIRRINDLPDIDAVRDIVFKARYLVLGLGDVYLGAPVATPIDPRHRLVTTKYNPARTWTPENAVGIGGAYLCVYGMEGPGGYQFVGRTIQMWNRYHETTEFQPGTPWLLRFFDQIQFHPVSHDELNEARLRFPQGHYPIKIEETTFRLADHNQFLEDNAQSIQAFQQKRSQAFDAERQDWIKKGLATFDPPETTTPSQTNIQIPEGCLPITSPVAGNVWTLQPPGTNLEEGDPALVIESMKMEVPANSPEAGQLAATFVEVGEAVLPGQILGAVKPG